MTLVILLAISALLAIVIYVHMRRRKPADVSERSHYGGAISDEPSKKDLLDFEPYAAAITEIIAHEDTQTPLVIGIFGSWGSGKSTLMGFIKDELLQKRRKEAISCRVISINVWQLSSQGEACNAFLQSLLTQVRSELGILRRARFSLRLLRSRIDYVAALRQIAGNGWKVLVTVAPILLTILFPDLTKDNNNEVSKILLRPLAGGVVSFALGIWLLAKPAAETLKNKVSLDLKSMLKDAPYEARISALQKLQSEFALMVETWVGDKGRLVIFADDMDRCAPDQIPQVLEALKLFTITRRCIYVIGLDQKVVARSIAVKHKDMAQVPSGELPIEGLRYLEKIIQIPFILPPIEIADMEKFVESLGCKWPHEGCKDVFSRGLPRNPRQIKRAVNVFMLLWQLAQKRKENLGNTITALRLAKVVALQTSHPDVFEYTCKAPQ